MFMPGISRHKNEGAAHPEPQQFAQIRRRNALRRLGGGSYFGKNVRFPPMGRLKFRLLPDSEWTNRPDAQNWPSPRTSDLLDCSFRLQQNRNAIANGINPLALVALKTVLAAQNERLATDGTRHHFQQLWADHNQRF